jgi:hypothetical protein
LLQEGDKFRCTRHNLSYRVLEFPPPPQPAADADAASDSYARCTEHPDQPATGICSATGSYICPRCTVVIDGRPLSYRYLTTAAGQKLLNENYISILPRPDYNLRVLILCLVLFPLTLVMLPLFFVGVPYSAVLLARVFELRRRNLYYRELVSRYVIMFWVIMVLLWLVLGIWFDKSIAGGWVRP